MDEIWGIAKRLSQTLYHFPWYHRTSFEEGCISGTGYQHLVVWGEDKQHEEVPSTFEGLCVIYRRVTKKFPCPFGSVKPDPKEGWGNKV